VWGKFLNFARIENFHILFPRRRDAARCSPVALVLVVLLMRQLQSKRKISQSDASPPSSGIVGGSQCDRKQQIQRVV